MRERLQRDLRTLQVPCRLGAALRACHQGHLMVRRRCHRPGLAIADLTNSLPTATARSSPSSSTATPSSASRSHPANTRSMWPARNQSLAMTARRSAASRSSAVRVNVKRDADRARGCQGMARKRTSRSSGRCTRGTFAVSYKICSTTVYADHSRWTDRNLACGHACKAPCGVGHQCPPCRQERVKTCTHGKRGAACSDAAEICERKCCKMSRP